MNCNLLVTTKTKLYFFLRPPDGRIYNKEESREEIFDIMHWEHYAFDPVDLGGNLYKFPTAPYQGAIIVYEQKGKKPKKTDRVIAVFGNITRPFTEDTRAKVFSDTPRKRA